MSSLAKSSQQALDFISQPSRRRPLFIVALLCLFAGTLWVFSSGSPIVEAPIRRPPVPTEGESPKKDLAWDVQRDWLNYRLTDEQCDTTFPRLFEELDKSRADRGNRKITLKELNSIPRKNGYVRGLVYEQQVCSHA